MARARARGASILVPMGAWETITRLELAVLVLLFFVMGWGATVLLGDVGSSSYERNRKRSEDVLLLENALSLYALEHDGRYPEGTEGEPKFICQQNASSCDGILDLRMLVPRYLEHIPTDPFAVGVRETFYTIHREGKRIIVAAPYAEGGETIQVER